MDGRRIGEGWTAQQVEAFFDVVSQGDPVELAVLEAEELGEWRAAA